jgi:heat shock protein HtpX
MAGIANTLKTGGLFGAMVAIFAVVGFLLGGMFTGDPVSSMILFLLIAGALNVVSLFWGDKMILRAYKAQEVSEADEPELHRIVSNISAQAGVPKPDIYVIDSETPNAFATGRSPEQGKVAFTTGIMRLLNEDELEGVAAHEMAHIQNRDMLVMTVAATLAAAVGFATRMAMWGSIFGGRDARQALPMIILLAVTAPIAIMIVKSAISRQREFKADAGAAELTGRPRNLASALRKLEQGNDAKPMRGGNPAHSSLFIANPFRGGRLAKLFSTHPPMDERIQRLNDLVYR